MFKKLMVFCFYIIILVMVSIVHLDLGGKVNTFGIGDVLRTAGYAIGHLTIYIFAACICAGYIILEVMFFFFKYVSVNRAQENAVSSGFFTAGVMFLSISSLFFSVLDDNIFYGYAILSSVFGITLLAAGTNRSRENAIFASLFIFGNAIFIYLLSYVFGVFWPEAVLIIPMVILLLCSLGFLIYALTIKKEINNNFQKEHQVIPGWLFIVHLAVIFLSVVISLACILSLILFCQRQDNWWNLWSYRGLSQYSLEIHFLNDLVPKILLFPCIFFLGGNIIGLIYAIKGRSSYQNFSLWFFWQLLFLLAAFILLPSISVIM